MPIDDPRTWIEGLGAAKLVFENLRSAISLTKDVAGLGKGTPEQQKAIVTALSSAESNTALAEAALGQAFGYQLCKCEFPPTPMRTVGYAAVNLDNGMKAGDPVYECPKCGYTNAAAFGYQRTAPPRQEKKSGSV
jgi:hypothetical protein